MIMFKKFLPVIALVACSFGVFGQLSPWWAQPDTVDEEAIEREAIADSIIDFAKTFIGTPYVWGGNDPNSGFDCSGFVCYVYKQFDIDLPRTSGQQFDSGTPIPYVEAQPGDLILFAGPNNGPGNPGHVGIVLSFDQDTGFSFIHTSSPESGGVRISNEKSEKYYFKKFLEIRRVIATE